MSLCAAQLDSTLRTLRTTCIACEPIAAAPTPAASLSKKKKKKKKKVSSSSSTWRVRLGDTVIFPVGGGQPADMGTLHDATTGALLATISSAARDEEGTIWHVADTAVDTTAAELEVRVNWERRFDHMQQHTAQHLISAIASRAPFHAKTLSWALSLPTANGCTIDFDNSELATTENAGRTLEAAVNAAIRDARAVRPSVDGVLAADILAAAAGGGGVGGGSAAPETTPSPPAAAAAAAGAPASKVDIARTSSKAVALQGVKQIRTVEIEGIDSNLCCGTHVTHLGELQAISFRSLKRTAKGAQLVFVAGDRLLHALSSAYGWEADLTKALCCCAEEFAPNVQRSQAAAKQTQRQLKQMQEKLALVTAEAIAASVQQSETLAPAAAAAASTAHTRLVTRHVTDDAGALKLLQSIISHLVKLGLGQTWGDRSIFVLTCGDIDSNGAGCFLVAAESQSEERKAESAAEITAVGKLVGKAVGGGGGGRNGRFQGKASKLGGWNDAAKAEVEAFLSPSREAEAEAEEEEESPEDLAVRALLNGRDADNLGFETILTSTTREGEDAFVVVIFVEECYATWVITCTVGGGAAEVVEGSRSDDDPAKGWPEGWDRDAQSGEGWARWVDHAGSRSSRR